MIFSPDKDIAKNAVVDLEDVQNRIKTTIASMVLNGSSKAEIESALNPLIYNYLKKLKVEDVFYKKQIEQALLNLAQSQYHVLKNNMKTINTSLISSIGGSYGIDLTNENATAKITQDKFRNFITKNKDTGTPLIDRYESLVREELKSLANQPAKVVTYNKNDKKVSYTMSARNLAEMKVRYEANVEDVNKEKEKGTKFVWISSHSNCSPRCAPFQGKLYSLDGTSGTIAGHKYVPIEVAQRGKNGDGNGCTNGYNCRHYIIPTSEEELQKGQRAPVNYNNSTIKKEQEIDARQRTFENQIRKLKKEESNLRAGGFSDEADKLNQRWKILEKKYQIYSLQNHRSFSRWRTQISRGEDVSSTDWSRKQAEEAKIMVQEEYKAKYQDAVQNGNIKITSKEDNGQKLFDAKLNTTEDFKLFERGTGRFYKVDKRFDRNNKEQCENVIKATLNIENNLKLGVPEFLKKKYGDDIEIKLAVPIYSRRREGSACHIANGHSDQYKDFENIDYLNKNFNLLDEESASISFEDKTYGERISIIFKGDKYFSIKKNKWRQKYYLVVLDYFSINKELELVNAHFQGRKIQQ